MNWKDYGPLKNAVLDRDKVCQKCHNTKELIVHHIIPKNVGGKDELNNLTTLCRSCHKRVHHAMATGAKNNHIIGDSIDLPAPVKINIDENAKAILDREKEALRKRGIRASLSDAIRSLSMGGQYVVDH